MSSPFSAGEESRTPISLDASTEAFEILSTPRRAAAVSVLADLERPVDAAALATHVAARESEKSVDDVSREERRAVRVSLVHHHLPKLSAHRIVDWDPADGEVAFADDAPLSPEDFRALFEGRSVAGRNRLFRTLSQPRRRAVAALLAADERVSVDELARRVAAREKGTAPEDVPSTDVDRVLVSLHHSHLPALDVAGLVRYDPDEGTVEG